MFNDNLQASGTRIVQSVQRFATGWTFRGTNPGLDEIFLTHPDRSLYPPSFLYSGYRVSFPVVKRPERGVDHPVPTLKK